MDKEFVWITARKAGRCIMCQSVVDQGARALWSTVNRNNLWCSSCAVKNGFTDKQLYTTSIGDGSGVVNSTTNQERAERSEAIRLAHVENMTANASLVKSIDDLTTVLKSIEFSLRVGRAKP